MPAATCPRCSKEFRCGIDTGDCWCAGVTLDETTRNSLKEFYDGCLCEECLGAIVEHRRPSAGSLDAVSTSAPDVDAPANVQAARAIRSGRR